MVQELVEHDKLHEHARYLAKKIAKAAPLGVQAALRSSKTSRVYGQETALKAVFSDLPQVMKSKDAQEGVLSFMQRREAVFTGK
jgi:enoyl-CoA hydratase/carnithine racemase